MRRIALVLGILLGLGLLWFAIQGYAAESGEVVVVRTLDDAEKPQETRLWVVDDAGNAWIRAGHPGAAWLLRLQVEPDIEIMRGGQTLAVRGIPTPEARERINALMAEKYGWADRFIGFFFSRDHAVPILLQPR